MTAPSSASTRPEPTHACVRCGRPVPVHVALCDDCNPLGLKQPAATQVHAIAAGGILLFVLFLAVMGRMALSHVGPFTGAITSVVQEPGGLRVTLAVTNRGTTNAATTCRIVGAEREPGGPGQVVQTANIAGGATLEVVADTSIFGTELRNLAVDCQSP